VGGEIKASRLFQARSRDLIYNRLFAWKGSFGIVGPDLDGCFVSGEFPLFRVDESQAMVEFVNLVMCRPSVWIAIERESTGSTATSRNRWKEERFAEWPLLLPPLNEQRRIVDLIAALDDATEVAEALVRASLLASVLSLADTYDQLPGRRIAVNAIADHVIGGSWGAAPGLEERAITALGTSSFQGDPVWVDPGAGSPRSLSEKRAIARSLQRGDIVLERSGGSDEQPVGRVIQAREDLPGVVPSDFMRLIRIDPDQADPSFVFWVMWLRYHRGETIHFQTHGTNIRNLRIPEYLATAITIPTPDDQVSFVALAEASFAYRRALGHVVTCLGVLRAALLDDLLSGEHKLPSSYDALLSA
jgi:type I restriction enzyme S subunit